MISTKQFIGDGKADRFLIDFYIQNEEYTRPYVYLYDGALPLDGSGDHLEDPNAVWSYPDNLWVRGGYSADIDDLIPTEYWELLDNSIYFYQAPPGGTIVYCEVATTAEELGAPLTYKSIEIAKTSALIAVQAANNAQESAEFADLQEDSARDYANLSSQWATNEFMAPIDDGIRTGYSAYHWAVVSEAYSTGLTPKGKWNPNTGVFDPPQSGTLEDGMYWICSADSTAPVYGEDWYKGDLLVYIGALTPDPYMKQFRATHWNNIIGKPTNYIDNREYTAIAGDTKFTVDFTEDNVTVVHNGITLAPSDFTLGTPDLDGISHEITLAVPADDGDTLYLEGIIFLNPDSEAIEWADIMNVPDNVRNAITQTELDAGLAPKADTTYVDAADAALELGITPVGGIIMYSGAFADIPSNWSICDGTNGTPDLTNRFIRGTATEGDVGTVGGSDDSILVDHSHTFTGTEINGTAALLVPTSHTSFATGAFYGTAGVGPSDPYYPNLGGTSAITDTNRYGYGFRATPSGTISTEGLDGTGANVPSYYTLAYIMRLS